MFSRQTLEGHILDQKFRIFNIQTKEIGTESKFRL